MTVADVVKKLLIDSPFYGTILLGMNRIETRKIPTMCISAQNGAIVLAYNPDFWNKLTDEQQYEVTKHELMHLCLFHPFQANDFADINIRNIAADAEVNQYLNIANLPAGCVDILKWYPNWPERAGMREYYRRLIADNASKVPQPSPNQAEQDWKDQQEQQSSFNQGSGDPDDEEEEGAFGPDSFDDSEDRGSQDGEGGGKGKEEKEDPSDSPNPDPFDDDSSDEGDGSENEEEDDEDDSEDNGDSASSNGSPNTASGNSNTNPSSSTTSNKPSNPPEFEDIVNHRSWDEISNMSDSEKELLRNFVESAITDAAKSCGNVPGEMQEIIGKIKAKNVPVFDWKGYLRRLVGIAEERFIKFTYRRPSKRFPDSKGAMQKRKHKMLIALDCSGSVSAKEVHEFYTTLCAMQKQDIEMRVIEFDTSVCREYPFEKWDGTITGRGGTDYEPVIKYTNEHSKIYNTVVIFTDGYCSLPATKSLLPIIWVISSDGNKQDYPGKVIYIPKENGSNNNQRI